MSNAIQRLIERLRGRPRLALGVGLTAIAAVVVGAVLGTVLLGARGVASEPAASEAPTAGETATARPSATVRASVNSPTPSPSETPTETSSPGPVATPVASPTPTTEPGYVPPPDDGWDPLPAMPNADALQMVDVVTLFDGRVVAFRFPPEGLYGGPLDVMVIRPGDDAWEPVALSREITINGGNAFTVTPSGLIYTHNWVIDPAKDPWSVEAFDLAPESDRADALIPVGTGPDGRIYHPAVDDGRSLIAFDPQTGEFTTSSRSTISFHDAISIQSVLGGDELVYLIDTATILAYDPGADTWAVAARLVDFMHAGTAGIGPDDRITLLRDNGELYVWPGQGELEPLDRPFEAPSAWNPVFHTGPDGRLWAVDDANPFVFAGP